MAGGRGIKNEFMVQLEGCSTKAEDKILLVGATNRPFDLDEAVLRRFQNRVLIPLPDSRARTQFFKVRI